MAKYDARLRTIWAELLQSEDFLGDNKLAAIKRALDAAQPANKTEKNIAMTMRWLWKTKAIEHDDFRHWSMVIRGFLVVKFLGVDDTVYVGWTGSEYVVDNKRAALDNVNNPPAETVPPLSDDEKARLLGETGNPETWN